MSYLNLACALVVLFYGVFFALNKMDRCTHHGIRIAWIVITAGAFSMIVAPFYAIALSDWPQTLFNIGSALFVVIDRRRCVTCPKDYL